MQDKVEVLAQKALPAIRKELQSFLGLANYYWCFVPHFVSTALPLTDLLKGRVKGTKPALLIPAAYQAFQAILEADSVTYTPPQPTLPTTYRHLKNRPRSRPSP